MGIVGNWFFWPLCEGGASRLQKILVGVKLMKGYQFAVFLGFATSRRSSDWVVRSCVSIVTLSSDSEETISQPGVHVLCLRLLMCVYKHPRTMDL